MLDLVLEGKMVLKMKIFILVMLVIFFILAGVRFSLLERIEVFWDVGGR